MKTKLYLTLLLAGTLGVSNAQWVAQPSGITAGYYAQFIDAVDTNTVWAIAADPANQSTPVAEFTKTIDGGNLWIAGNITNAAGLSPSGIFGLNADTAWVAMFNGIAGGGKILRTTDGGVNWTWQNTAVFAAPAGFPNFVHFFDGSNGICMGDPNGGYFEIYTTTDGGDNWVRTPQPNIPGQLTGEFGITSVYTTNGDSTLWFGTNFGRIYKTSNRGINWTVALTPYAIDSSYIGDIAFKDALNGIASNGSPGSAVPDLINTTDGGLTWNLMATNTANIATKLLTTVPNTPGTYFLSSPQAGGGSAFSLNDGNTWAPVDNLIHSDIDFVNEQTGWTGSNELGAPMFKWSGPVQSICAQITGPLQFASSDSICAFDSIVYSVNVDLTGDPSSAFGFNAVFYDESFNQIGAQSVPNLISAGFPNSFTPDPGNPLTGTLNFTIFFSLASTNEIVHFSIQLFPSQCLDDTSNAIINSVFQDVSGCATANVNGYLATLDLTGCPQTGLVNYDVSYSANGGPFVSGSVFDCSGYTGIVDVEFLIDNGVCEKSVTTQINCTGLGFDEQQSTAFHYYPNPANDVLTIQTGSLSQIGKLEISDLSGRVVIRMTRDLAPNTTLAIPVSELSSGAYLITVFSASGETSVKKLIKY